MYIKDIINEMASLNISQEMIDHQYDSTFGKELEEELKIFRNSRSVTSNQLKDSNLSKIIKEYTGLTVQFELAEFDDAFARIPRFDFNHILETFYVDENILTDIDIEKQFNYIFAHGKFIDGGINLSTGKVFGDFTKLNFTIGLGPENLRKGSYLTIEEVTAIILHEIGHIVTHLILFTKLTKTNFVIHYACKQLLTTNSKEVRIKLLLEVDRCLGIEIEDKDKVASTQGSEDLYFNIILSAEIKKTQQQLKVNLYSARGSEQLADIYTSRYGYARAFATGMDKTYRMFGNRTYTNPWLNVFLLVCEDILIKFGSGFMSEPYILYLLCNNDSPYYDRYDPPKIRILKLKQQLNDALKDTNLPKDIKAKYVNDFTIVNNILDKMYNNWSYMETKYALSIFLFRKAYKERKEINEHIILETYLNNDLFSAAAALDLKSNKE